MTKDDRNFHANGRFKKGHKGFSKHSPEYLAAHPPVSTSSIPSPPDANTDLDTAILTAASSFGTPSGKAKTGLPGYCNNLRDTRPQDFAALVSKATARVQYTAAARAAAIPITVLVSPVPTDQYLSREQAQALYTAHTGTPTLVIDNETTIPDDSFSDPDDDAE